MKSLLARFFCAMLFAAVLVPAWYYWPEGVPWLLSGFFGAITIAIGELSE